MSTIYVHPLDSRPFRCLSILHKRCRLKISLSSHVFSSISIILTFHKLEDTHIMIFYCLGRSFRVAAFQTRALERVDLCRLFRKRSSEPRVKRSHQTTQACRYNRSKVLPKPLMSERVVLTSILCWCCFFRVL